MQKRSTTSLLTYTVQSTDGTGNDTENVVVTITGTNDAPVFSLLAGDLAAVSIAETNAVISAADTITVRDLDRSNTVSTLVTAVSAVGTVGSTSNATFLAMLTSTVGAVNANMTDASNINWSFNSGAANAFDYLAAGQQVALTYTITGMDTSGATATQAVTVTVTGTNDTPTMSFVSSTETNFTVNAIDPDASALLQLQTAVNGVTTVTNGGNSILNVLQQGSTVVTDIVITDGIVDSAILKTLVQGTALNDTFAPTVSAGLYYGFGGDDTITGGANADIIYGGAGNDVINGGAGNDAIDGGAGNDSVVFDASDITVNGVSGGADIDTINAATAAAGVTINLSSATDAYINFENITGSSFNDILTGDAGANVINGGAGNDIIDGGAGNDAIDGGAGNDSVVFDSSDITVDGVNGGADIDTINAATAAAGVTINLSSASDVYINFENITATGFNDVLTGDAGNNLIFGGNGADVMTGGAGVDTFLFLNPSNSVQGTMDSILDFTVGVGGDVLDLAAFAGAGDTYYNTTAFASFAALQAAANGQIGSNAEIYIGTDGVNSYVFVDSPENNAYNVGTDLVIQLTGVTNLAALNPANFIGDSGTFINLG